MHKENLLSFGHLVNALANKSAKNANEIIHAMQHQM